MAGKANEVEKIVLAKGYRGLNRLPPFLPENFCDHAAGLIPTQPGTVFIITGFYISAAGAPETGRGPVQTTEAQFITFARGRKQAPRKTYQARGRRWVGEKTRMQSRWVFSGRKRGGPVPSASGSGKTGDPTRLIF